MRLSEVKGERVFDVVAEIIDPIAEIALDEDAAKLFKREACPKGMEPWQFFMEKARKSLPSLIRAHKSQFVHILATIKGVSDDEYVEGVTFTSLFSDVIELVTDTEFASFFS